jgi:tetratricopeptide (TPR) repeat protein
VRGLVFRERRQYIDALADAEKAITLDASYANGYILLSTILYYAGRPADGLAMIEKAEKINPLHPSNYPFHKGQALFILRRYDEAIDAFRKGLAQNPTSQRLHVWLAATYAQVGRMEEAQWEADQVLMADPDIKLSRLFQIFPFKDPAELEHFNRALRKVGFEDRW